jgi:hypothetical protein
VDVRDEVFDWLGRLSTAVDEWVDAPVWPLSEPELLSCLSRVHSAQQRLTAVAAHLVREIEGRGIPRAHGATSTAVWLRQQLRMSVHEGKRLADLATILDRRPGLDAAVTAGLVSGEQAAVIHQACAVLPADEDPAVLAKAEAVLIDQAAWLTPAELRQAGARILHHLDADHEDKRHREALERQARRARQARTLHLTPVEDGKVRVTGWLDGEAAATVRAALDPLCRPLVGDDRTPGQRRADALTEVCALALRTADLPTSGGDRPQLVVTVPFDVLRGRAGTATLDTGERLTAAQARRLACDAHVLPAVLGGDGELLDLGRTRRLFTGATRRALILRDGGCAFPGCDRPHRWCEGHHIRPWAAGGGTDVDNGVLLCGHHHRLLHSGNAARWEVRLGADKRPEFLPPAFLDPARRPRRNTYHLRT